jgi:hypothetical protein
MESKELSTRPPPPQCVVDEAMLHLHTLFLGLGWYVCVCGEVVGGGGGLLGLCGERLEAYTVGEQALPCTSSCLL